MAIINSTSNKVLRTQVSTVPTGTAGQTTSRNAANNVPTNTIVYEIIKENLGDTPDQALSYEYLNVGKIHSQNS